ncbi:unnamed protein product, partial [Prorocentrum cordatum]
AQLYVPLVPLLYFVWVLVLVVLGTFDLPCRDVEGDSERALFAKHKCYCDDNEATKTA